MPTRRLAHFLRARHDAACAARGLRVWRTPDLVTWTDWLRRQFEADRAAGRTTARWLTATHARLAWEQIVRRDEAHLRVLAGPGLGAAAYRSWTLLHQYRIPYAALAEADGPEAQAFAAWVGHYRHWLQQGGWLDPALAAGTVGPFPDSTALSFVGFDRWTPEQAELLEKLRQDRVPLTIVAAGLEDDAPIRGQVAACDDFEGELETAARWAAAFLQREPAARIALVVPALDRERSRVRRVLDRVLVPGTTLTGGPAPESSAYELAAARPLAERPVVAAALAWLDACTNPAEPARASALLLGPHDGAAAAELHARAELDVALRRSGTPMPGLDRLAVVAHEALCTATAGRLEAALARSRTWRGRQLPSQWAPQFMGVLRDVGWPGANPDSAEHQAAQRWQVLLGEFGASDDVTGPMPAPAALGHLRELALTTAFEPQEIAAPLLVIDPETAVGMDFDAAWICGLDAARWPAPASPDPFLPRDWQARQGVPGATAELAEQAARRTLQRLTHAAATVICSVPRFEDEAPLLPSAFVADLLPAAPELWRGPDATHALLDARPVLHRSIDAALPAFAAHDMVKGGTRLLELQAACPFRAAVELRLGGRQLEDPVIGIAPTERGQLAHDVLEAFWREVREQSALLAMPAAERELRIRGITARVLEPLRRVADEVRRRLLDLEQEWLVARALELLEEDSAREPFTVVEVEAERLLDVGGVQVRVVLDRVDRLADGSFAFIDYKTGASAKPADWLGERPELPQLPLYLRSVGQEEVGALAFGIVRTGATGYRGFAREAGLFGALQPFDASRPPFREYGDWKGLMREWQRRLDAIAREHAQGDARLAPNPVRACRYCHLPGLCRSAQALVGAEEDDDAAG